MRGANLDCRMAVIGQRKDAARILSPHTHKIGDPVHEHARLPGSGPRQYQDGGLLAVVSHDPLLDGILERFNDRPPRFWQGLTPQFLHSSRQPLLNELVARERKIVHCEPGCIGLGRESAFCVLGHHMDLHCLLAVVLLQRLEVGLQK